VLQRHGGDLQVAVGLRRPDGRIIRYALAVDARTREPKVREKAPENLPAFCPDRHINRDGSFCMNWQSADPIYVTDETSAREWWSRLLKYLRLQEAAKQLRRWPSKLAWAHGAAADAQRRAEVCSIALGPAFQDALAAKRLRVTRRSGQPKFVRLEDDGRRLYSVWIHAKRVATRRQRCLCGSGRPLCSCADHADRAAELVTVLEAWAAGERAFWRQFDGRACCGTLSSCPLRAALSPASMPTPPSIAATARAA
jgi:hypothetical protein